MQLVGERRLADAQAPAQPLGLPSPTPTPTTIRTTAREPDLAAIERELGHRAAWKAGIVGSLNVIVAVLAIRLILLLAVIGAFALQWVALADPSPLRLAAVAIYALTVVLPVVWLSMQRR